jgi:hypothetical protein
MRGESRRKPREARLNAIPEANGSKREPEPAMRLTAPTTIMFLLSVLLAVLALVSLVFPIPFVGLYRFAFMTGAWAVLMIGVMLRGV